jgi:class 3 adenylate cyclase
MVADVLQRDLGKTLVPSHETRIQLCGRVTVCFAGRRIEGLLPGRQGRILFAYLTAYRRQPATRGQVMQALWSNNPPDAADTALSALLTKLRAVLGTSAVSGKHEIRLALPGDVWIDLEAALEGLHRAESAVARREWAAAWGPSRVALHIALRPFLPGYDGAWIDEIRRRLEDVLIRAHECIAAAGLGLAGVELASAERSARALIRLAPYRESGYRLLMEVLVAQGNVADALRTYESLRQLLREELGASPGAATQALHKRLLQGGAGGDSASRELKTVLFADVVGSAEVAVALGDRAWQALLSQHQAAVRRELLAHGGREVDAAGDGFLLTFDAPAHAAACAAAIVRGATELGLRVRVGIHTGECEVQADRVAGVAVHMGARIAATAAPGQILVSSTVRDLMAGAGVEFKDVGIHTLRGVPGEWRLFAVDSESIAVPRGT